MGKTFKKLSFILVLVLFISMFSGVPASAETTPYIKSDTSSTMKIASNGEYTFKFTVIGTIHGKPVFSVGNSNVLKGQLVKQSGNDYYVKISGVGKQGQSTGIYSTLPGQAAVRQAVVTLLAWKIEFPYSNTALCTTFSKDNLNNDDAQITDWSSSMRTDILFGEDDYSNAEVTVTNNNPDVLKISQRGGNGNAVMEPTFTAHTTVSGKREELNGGIWEAKSSLPNDNYFYVTGIKGGEASITLTAKSPTTGQIEIHTQYFTLLDPSKAVIKSDTTLPVNLPVNKSYTFRCSVAPAEVANIAFFEISGPVYDRTSEGETVEEDGNIKTTITNAGNGVYYIKVTAQPDFTYYPNYPGETRYLKKGEVITLRGGFEGLGAITLATIKII